MMHPHTRLAHVGDDIGLGVVATQFIPAGTLIWVRDGLDQVIPRDQAAALGPLYGAALKHFTFWEADGDLVLCWDHGRFVNHSCDANSLGGGFDDFEIAVRDILPGDQLTDDYATFGYAHEFVCGCGAGSCRGRVSRRDADAMAPVWDRAFAAALDRSAHVEQPLWSLLPEPALVRQAQSDPSQIPGHARPAPTARLLRNAPRTP